MIERCINFKKKLISATVIDTPMLTSLYKPLLDYKEDRIMRTILSYSYKK